MGPIFRDFFQVASSVKLKTDPFPADCITDEEKDRYCADINSIMGYDPEGTLALTRDNIKPCKSMRLTAKNILNSVSGKHLQHNLRIEQKYVTSQEMLDQYLHDGQLDLLSWNLLNPSLLHLRLRTKYRFSQVNRTCNIATGMHFLLS